MRCSPAGVGDDVRVLAVAAVAGGEEHRAEPGIGHELTDAVLALERRRPLGADIELRRQVHHVHGPPVARRRRGAGVVEGRSSATAAAGVENGRKTAVPPPERWKSGWRKWRRLVRSHEPSKKST